VTKHRKPQRPKRKPRSCAGEGSRTADRVRLEAGQCLYQPNEAMHRKPAMAIAKACGIETQVIDQLNDIDYGAWQMRTYEEIKETDPQLFTSWFDTPHLVRFPNGESLQDLVARSADAPRVVLNRHIDDTVVLVGHNNVNRALLLQLLDQPLSAYWRLTQDPCCINEIDMLGGFIHVIRINEASQLEGVRV
jgi:broad specificity phosphatase PhoE